MAGSKKGRQAVHNKETHKYENQKVRTARNKARNVAKAKVKEQGRKKERVNG